MNQWLAVVGIGEAGWDELSGAAQSLVQQATLIVGGARHLAMLPPTIQTERLSWSSPIQATIAAILSRRGQPVCVLASGDPMCYGIGGTLLRQVDFSEMVILPAVSAFSLACARMGWALNEVEQISLCGRHPALLSLLLYPGARLLILSADRQTPAQVAQILRERGFGASQITVLEHMGGVKERRIEGIAAAWSELELADLNSIALHCISAGDTAQSYSRLAGLPDAAYQHDGQLTKREVRAITLAALAPLPGQLLWDVGAGCGSISIEWLRSHPQNRAIAVESHPTRLQYLAQNAVMLGVPSLEIVGGRAPDALQGLAMPDAIFIGGGLTTEYLLEICWPALRPGGRLVANAVTVETEQILFAAQQRLGGSLTRLAVQRAEPIGKFLGWKAMAPITQWTVIKNDQEMPV
ncbi:MAG: precorrin-6y C5,15-methyltransferase (decarboxylating) subunit CbiE [Pegethrix bostrychoides GSE-TBD4-15B]|jgi:precorrin-6Y C5,15-methyltransferase (decarboxylating)|uniref:Precorrin-6y C5,15-methyltransferase (Decarboxylating) subunit CbiE n=1 Tax=Pegethrix bostrychoides GSE-TBD4-15B TaxID=2839662 RepID=A0A951P8U1_9CYAN|nr:precorrin-6y C5,15-methyltransferase (decarboxylating) subunit CbiE [Pegethrix bostrychoides GSE-TBD4-15B]